jgi:predicted DNA-binding antitoxin AbrB/MazE fold protein
LQYFFDTFSTLIAISFIFSLDLTSPQGSATLYPEVKEMIETIPAIYENGIFRPLKKVHLKEHQMLTLKLEVAKEDYESLLETLEILSDQGQVKRIASALRNIEKGKLFSHKDVFGHPQPNL